MTKPKTRNNNKRPAKAVVMDLPEFESEREEAKFWDANPNLITAAMRAALHEAVEGQ
jgi:hypothetical protein